MATGGAALGDALRLNETLPEAQKARRARLDERVPRCQKRAAEPEEATQPKKKKKTRFF